MHIRCPHCQNSVEVVEDVELQDLVCPSCGSSFNLLPDETITCHSMVSRTLGRFELVERIGVGAFGEVWTARDTELDRTVAVKLPRKSQLTVEETESFLREARSAAQLHHPSIVAVHEVGKDDDTLYIVSDFVQGITLADWLSAKRPAPKEAAELCAKIAEAVQHAHEHGVIHRDLKPSNIMLDDDGRPHIMDFGLAKRDAGEITMTVKGRILGTPAYMSPEQAKGSAHDADQRSDVYSLGVILFELLTGELPFRGNARMLVHQVINDEAPSPRRLNNSVPRDLETLCLKCLEKDADKRYSTASAFADDLQRFLNGEPIAARPASQIQRGWRSCKRRPLVTGLALVVIGLLLAIATVAPITALSQARLKRIAQEETAEAKRLLYLADIAQARQAWEKGDLGRLKALLENHRPDDDEIGQVGFEWYYLWRLWKREADAKRISLPDSRKYAAINLDAPATGSRLVVAHPVSAEGGPAATLVNIEQDTKTSFGSITASVLWPPFVAISRTGRLLAFAEDDPTAVVIQDLKTNSERTMRAESAVYVARFSPDDRILALGCEDGSIVLWDCVRWRETGRMNAGQTPVSGLAYSPNGTVLVSAGAGADIVAWNVASKKQMWRAAAHSERGIGLAFSPDAKYVAHGSGSTVTLRYAETGEIWRVLTGPRDEVRSVAFSPNGRLLAAGSRDSQIRVWLLPDLCEFSTIGGYNSMYALAFMPAPDEKLVFGGHDGHLVVRDVQTGGYEDIVPCGKLRDPTGMVFSPDSRVLAAFGAPISDKLRMWKLGPKSVEVLESLPLGLNAGAMAISCDGTVCVGDANVGALRLFDLDSRKVKGELPNSRNAGVTCAAFSPNGRRLAVGYSDGVVVVWDVKSQRPIFDIPVHTSIVRCLAFCGDGSTLASGSGDSTAAVWDIDRTILLRNFGRQDDSVTSMASVRDGSTLAIGHFVNAPAIDIWNGDSWSRRNVLQGHTLTIWGLGFLQRGSILVSASGDRTVRFWDLEKGEEKFLIEEKTVINLMAISPDERTIAANLGDGTIRLYRAASPDDIDANPRW